MTENILTDIIRQFSNRNENELLEPKIVSDETHITIMAKPWLYIWEEALQGPTNMQIGLSLDPM